MKQILLIIVCLISCISHPNEDPTENHLSSHICPRHDNFNSEKYCSAVQEQILKAIREAEPHLWWTVREADWYNAMIDNSTGVISVRATPLALTGGVLVPLDARQSFRCKRIPNSNSFKVLSVVETP